MSFVEQTAFSIAPNAGSSFYIRHGKRGLDIALAMVLMPFVALIIAPFALAVRLDGGPAFFGHARVGRGGKSFRCWKLRSMAVNADARLQNMLASDAVAARLWQNVQKLENDPRVTPLGRWLRRLSIDELPQVWNVLCGDMSFVGPRPVTLGELARYGEHRSAYLAQRPGITGLWQVFGRGDGDYARRVMLDVVYGTQQRFWTDLGLILLTAACLIVPSGR